MLTLKEKEGGTRISSTRYVHYGTISATCEYQPINQPIKHSLRVGYIGANTFDFFSVGSEDW